MTRRFFIGPVLTAFVLATTACGSKSEAGPRGSDGEAESGKVRIAKQFGIGYAPLVVLENSPDIVEKYLSGVEVSWTQLGAGTSLRDAMLADQLDVGSGGAGPVIEGVSKGVEFAIATGLVQMPMWMVTRPDGPQDLASFGDEKIAVPGLNSSQHVLLRAALKEEGLEPTSLDQNLAVMPHPDGFSAFTSGQVAAHISSAPFQYNEVAEGGTKIVDSYDLWGRHTFMTVYVTRAWAEENPETFDGLVAAIQESTQWLNDNKEEAAQLLSEASGGETKAEAFLAQLNEPSLTFTSEISNIKPMADAMYDLDFIESEVSVEDLFFESAGVEGEDW